MNASWRPARAFLRSLGLISTVIVGLSSANQSAAGQTIQGRVEEEGSMRLVRQPGTPQAQQLPPHYSVPSDTGLNDAMFAVAPRARSIVPPAGLTQSGALDSSSRSLSGSVSDTMRSLLGSAGLLGTTGKGLFDTITRRAGMAHSTLRLNAADRQLVANSDIAIVIDHSGSMKTRDCPGGNNRMFASRLESITTFIIKAHNRGISYLCRIKFEPARCLLPVKLSHVRIE